MSNTQDRYKHECKYMLPHSSTRVVPEFNRPIAPEQAHHCGCWKPDGDIRDWSICLRYADGACTAVKLMDEGFMNPEHYYSDVPIMYRRERRIPAAVATDVTNNDKSVMWLYRGNTIRKYAAGLIIRVHVAQGSTARWITWRAATNKASNRRDFDKHSSYEEWSTACLNADVLVVDDFTPTHAMADSAEEIFSIISQRVDSNKLTVVTSYCDTIRAIDEIQNPASSVRGFLVDYADMIRNIDCDAMREATHDA